MPDPTSNKFFVQEIRVHGLPVGKGIPTQVGRGASTFERSSHRIRE